MTADEGLGETDLGDGGEIFTVCGISIDSGTRQLGQLPKIPPLGGDGKLGVTTTTCGKLTQDLTVFNVTKEAVVARQAKVSDQLLPIPGVPSVDYTPVEQTPPAGWAEAIIPVD